MTHNELAISLAAHLRTELRMTWCDLQLGPSASPRPDVYTINRSYSSPQPIAYEVKVSRADMRADLVEGKWQKYLRFASGVFFACEGDLITKADLPDHCGLMVYRTSWRTAKRAVLNPVTIPQDAFMKLLIDGIQREGPVFRRNHQAGYRAETKIAAKFGERVAAAVMDVAAVEYEAEQSRATIKRIEDQARENARREVEELAPLRDELIAILGLDAGASRFAIHSAVRQLRNLKEEHPDSAKLRSLTNTIQMELSRYGYKQPAPEPEEVA